jgi:DNA-binding response OmpR family regulator
LFRALIIAEEKEQVRRLGTELYSEGLLCSIEPNGQKFDWKLNGQAPDLVLVALNGAQNDSRIIHISRLIREQNHLPVIALLSREALSKLDSDFPSDDFVVAPWDAAEVAARVKRILGKAKNAEDQQIIKCGELTIDTAKYEVYVNNRPVELTFKEYELLKFLAIHKGRVFTREALLNEVWGYDYYGGDRTVDVHIRRLRSKIEDSTHIFIETVRNIGYKFKESL